MHPSIARVAAPFLLLLLGAIPAAAQLIPGWDAKQGTFDRLDADRLLLVNEVEIAGEGPNAGQQIFADRVEWNIATGEFTATGNVLVVTPTSRLAAERVVFNTKTKLGTFYTASGIASLGAQGVKDKSMFGTLEPDVYFYGETIDKIGEDKYRITKGGFTTCVQPTPRWDIVSGSSTINLGDYAILRNAVIRVKDVPVFYLPIMYYPIQDDGRSTGFLMPTYGRSTYRGQSLSNAFFWAINRSQDLTLLHDLYSNTGQGAGSEYRYIVAPGSEGLVRAFFLNEKESEFELAGGGTSVTPARRTYEISGGMSQRLPGSLQARGRVEYFSNITTQQLYNNNIYEASRRQRMINGSVSGAWGGLSTTGNYQRNELFYSETDSIVSGYGPSVSASLASKRIGRLPIYYAVSGEASNILYLDKRGGTETDYGLGRFDVSPSVRAALSTLPFLNLNTTLLYRFTHFTESLNARSVQVPVPLTRRYLDMRADVLGPTFSRVFTPNNAFADRVKHLIEPNFSIQRTTSITNQQGVVTVGSSYDYVVGGTTRIGYGLTNRLLVRKAPPPGSAAAATAAAASAPRELLSIGISQSYYSDELASKYDMTYQSSWGIRDLSHYSPIAITARTAPTALSTATVRMEYDHAIGVIQGFSATGTLTYPTTNMSIGWSTRRVTDLLMDNAINASTTLNFNGGRTGGTYYLNWDIGRSILLQQRWVGFYNAQCCGLAIEYQEYNFPAFDPRYPVPKDRRFNLSFTLAGIGTFSNFFGTFGGARY